jgi:hypothetical protein
MIQIENLQFEYHNILERHRHKMDLLLQEKKVAMSNCEEDTKKYLLKILGHIREVKQFRMIVKEFERRRSEFENNEKDIFKAFRRRNEEISVIMDISLLNKIKKYSNELNKVYSQCPIISDDEMRVKGLELIYDLKMDILKVKTPP